MSETIVAPTAPAETAPVAPAETPVAPAAPAEAAAETAPNSIPESETGVAAPQAARAGEKAEAKADAEKAESQKAEKTPDQGEIDYAKVDLGVADLDPVAVAQFANIARDLKLSPEQMRGLAKWQETFSQQTREEMATAGIAALQKEYGQAFERMRGDANALISKIDAATNGEFGKALGRVGALCDPGIAKGFMLIAQAFSEDSLGATGDNAAQLKPETAYDGLKAAFAKK